MHIKVVIIGSGNVAFHLTKRFVDQGNPPIQVYNRSRKGLGLITKKFDVQTTSSIKKIRSNADIYIIAVADDGIEQTCMTIHPYIHSNAIVCHTSGNVSIEKLGAYFQNYGSFYPLQSFRKERDIDFSVVPMLIVGNNIICEKQLLKLAKTISERVIRVSDQERSMLHIPAVMVNNFVNNIYGHAFDYCTERQLDYSILSALIQETMERAISGKHPKKFQTGPAVRHDQGTIKKHKKALRQNKDLLQLYNFMSTQIQKYHHEDH